MFNPAQKAAIFEALKKKAGATQAAPAVPSAPALSTPKPAAPETSPMAAQLAAPTPGFQKLRSMFGKKGP